MSKSLECLPIDEPMKSQFFTEYLKRKGHKLDGATDIRNIHTTKIQRLREVMEGIKNETIKFIDDPESQANRSPKRRKS